MTGSRRVTRVGAVADRVGRIAAGRAERKRSVGASSQRIAAIGGAVTAIVTVRRSAAYTDATRTGIHRRAGVPVAARRPVRHRREDAAVAFRTVGIAGGSVALVTGPGAIHRRAAAATGRALVVLRAGVVIVAGRAVGVQRLAIAHLFVAGLRAVIVVVGTSAGVARATPAYACSTRFFTVTEQTVITLRAVFLRRVDALVVNAVVISTGVAVVTIQGRTILTSTAEARLRAVAYIPVITIGVDGATGRSGASRSIECQLSIQNARTEIAAVEVAPHVRDHDVELVWPGQRHVARFQQSGHAAGVGR